MVKDNIARLKGNEGAMWQSIEILDDMLEDMKEDNPNKYWCYMRRLHEAMFGEHYNKEYAIWEVEQMHHIDENGKVNKGEYWGYEETTAVMSKYRTKLPIEITPCDFYVALNAQYHDYWCLERKKHPTEEATEAAIIEMAIHFWFLDEDWDAPTKVWRYFRMKK